MTRTLNREEGDEHGEEDAEDNGRLVDLVTGKRFLTMRAWRWSRMRWLCVNEHDSLPWETPLQTCTVADWAVLPGFRWWASQRRHALVFAANYLICQTVLLRGDCNCRDVGREDHEHLFSSSSAVIG